MDLLFSLNFVLSRNIKALFSWLCIKVALEIPSSSSPRLLFMYVKVPDPMPDNGWSNIAFLHIFVPLVADLLFRRR